MKTTKQTTSYIFFNDPGHAWLRVPIVELHELGIASKISSYSYQTDVYAYLEEDCDAFIFLHAKYGADVTSQWLHENNIITEHHTNNDSFIRSLNCYNQYK